jgi:threonine/homoserine/homoserine lactone efflux protein
MEVFYGFRFGMLLQLAVGPMCLLVFSTAASSGFFSSFKLVLAIALIDALYIFLACIGVGKLISKPKIKKSIKIFGGTVLMIFALNIFFGAFGFQILPALSLSYASSTKSIFLKGILLTASNPLTIIFWSGVFSAQIADNNYAALQLAFFGFGCVLSTLSFLTAVGILGTFVSSFVSQNIIRVLNILVGIIIMYFAIRMFIKKENTQ